MKRAFTLIILFTFFMSGNLLAQEEKALLESEESASEGSASILLGADLMSRYVWRGRDYGNSPAIQPNLAFTWKGLAIGAWGSYAFGPHSVQVNDSTMADAGHYSEMDLYISYTYKWFTLMLFDYFTVNGLDPNSGNRYFDYNNATTGHTLELCLTYQGPESFPLQVLASTLVYGADKGKDSTGVYGAGTENNYSTYFEVSYQFNIRPVDIKLKPFIGGIPFGGSWYGPYAGVINLGLQAKKDIPITEKFSLPIQASLVTNPQAQSVFLVFGISL